MDKIKKFFSKSREGRDEIREVQPVKSTHTQKVDTDRFAKTAVDKFGETLVLLGKE